MACHLTNDNPWGQLPHVLLRPRLPQSGTVHLQAVWLLQQEGRVGPPPVETEDSRAGAHHLNVCLTGADWSQSYLAVVEGVT